MTTEVGRARPFVLVGLIGGVALMLIAIAVAVLTSGPGPGASPTPSPAALIMPCSTSITPDLGGA